jgi:hypothetical protein
MMVPRKEEPSALFYDFCPWDHALADRVLRSVDHSVDLNTVSVHLAVFYCLIGPVLPQFGPPRLT